MAKIIPTRVFEDYEPPSDLVTEEECDTLHIYLPGFKKEQLRVQLTTLGMLKISGERPLGDHKYRRFHKEFKILSKCDSKKITAKFEGGILYIREPKLTTPPSAPPPPPPSPSPSQRQQKVPEKAKDEEEKKEKVVNYGLFKELRKPENMKKLGVSVAMVLISALFISYMFKSCTGGKNGSMMGYDLEL